MKIQTSEMFVASQRQNLGSAIPSFVKNEDHHLAMTPDIVKAIGVSPSISVKIDSGPDLHAVSPASKSLTAEQRLAIEKAAMTFGSSTLPILKHYVPNFTGAIDGIEIVFATKAAFDAWADPERTSMIKPIVKTTRALFEVVDVAQTAIPALKNVPYVGAVGAFIKVGDSVVQLWMDVSKAVKAK